MKEELQQGENYRWKYSPPRKSGYLYLKNGLVDNTLPLVDGKVMMDRDKNGEIIGIEILLD